MQLSQTFKRTLQQLVGFCRALVEEPGAMAALRAFDGDLFIGDVATPCSWALSDLLQYAAPFALRIVVSFLSIRPQNRCGPTPRLACCRSGRLCSSPSLCPRWPYLLNAFHSLTPEVRDMFPSQISKEVSAPHRKMYPCSTHVRCSNATTDHD